jgi:DNA primase
VTQTGGATGEVILNFDADPAGSRSAEKYTAQFLAEGLRVKILELPDSMDPDEYIQNEGEAAYADRANRATSYFHWLLEQSRNRFDFQTVEGRADAFRSLLPTIQHVNDAIERSAIANELAASLKVDREILMKQLRRPPAAQTAARKNNNSTSVAPPNEVQLLACLLCSEDARNAIIHFLGQSPVLDILENRKIFEAALDLQREDLPFSIDALTSRLEPRFSRLLIDVSFSQFAVDEESAAVQALHCLKALEDKAWQARCTELRRKIREHERSGNLEAALMLATELDQAKSRQL